MLIFVAVALRLFTGSGNLVPFSVDLPDFCRSFRVKSNTTIKIYILNDVITIIEMHNIIEENSLFEILTTVWYKIIFWTQNRMNCKLCSIMRRDLGLWVVAHRFLQRKKLFNFDKVGHWNLTVCRCWWETLPVFNYVGSWKKRVVFVGNDFWRMISQSRKLRLLYDFNQFIPALYGQRFFSLVGGTTISTYGRCFLFWGLGASFNTILFFGHLFGVIPPDNLSTYQRTLILSSSFLRHAVCEVNPLELFSQTVHHHERGTCSTWVVFTDKHIHPFSWFLNVNCPFLNRKKEIDSPSHDWSFHFWTFHIWYKVMSNTCYKFSPLILFHWISQVLFYYYYSNVFRQTQLGKESKKLRNTI